MTSKKSLKISKSKSRDALRISGPATSSAKRWKKDFQSDLKPNSSQRNSLTKKGSPKHELLLQSHNFRYETKNLRLRSQQKLFTMRHGLGSNTSTQSFNRSSFRGKNEDNIFDQEIKIVNNGSLDREQSLPMQTQQ